MTKAVATTAALQLVEQGRLSLDATVASALPEFAQLQVLDGFDGDQPRLRPPASAATMRQLMTHTAGLGYFFTNSQLLRYLGATGTPSPLSGDKRSLMAPLVNDPGTAWAYGVNTDWLGLVLEKITGQSLGDLLQQQVYAPLGMRDSTFKPDDAQRERLLRVMQRQADGGGLLEPDTVRMALQNHLGGIALPAMMASAVPELSNDVPSMPVPQGWGLGFHLTLARLPGMRSAGTADWACVFNSDYWIDRTRGVGAVLMTQLLPFFDMPVVETLMGFEAAVYQQVGAVVPAG